MPFTTFQASRGIKRSNLHTTGRRWYKERTSLRLLLLTLYYRQCRLNFCLYRTSWNEIYWRQMIFIDEFHFSLNADDDCMPMQRESGLRSNPAFVVERHAAVTQGISIWKGICWDTRSVPVVLQGTRTVGNYVNRILTQLFCL